MKPTDLFKMCWGNLFRRKARTFLSVLGVVIGCASILIMMSIGVGLNASQQSWISEMGDLSKISVYSQYDASGKATMVMDDSAVATLKTIEYVQTVAPKLGTGDLSFQMSAGNNGRYSVGYAEIIGYDTDVMESMGYEIIDGELPSKPGTAIMGQYFEYSLMDTRRPDGSNMIDYYMYDTTTDELPDPYMELINKPMTFYITDDNGNTVYSTEIRITGKVKEDYGKGYETSQGLLLRKDDLQMMIKEAKKALGQKVGDIEYNEISVMVSDISKVSEVETAIQDLGFETSSMESMRESTEKEMATIQLVLGGIGGVSLFVAAIGIINTMIMSVSERTKEIGVMKAIGCYVGDIRKLFLTEAACIGLMGGVIGTIFSFAVSCVINIIAGNSSMLDSGEEYTMFEMMFTSPNRISVIPLWLLIFGLAFSMFVGLVAGFYPANKAVKISALEAMRNE